jgi:hypothetical protein
VFQKIQLVGCGGLRRIWSWVVVERWDGEGEECGCVGRC